jgi:mono/diheme cytochrome c family protein
MRSTALELSQALAFDKLEEFVRQEEARGAELVQGSDFERALALLIIDGYCSACHSRTGTLTGGENAGDHLPVPVGSMVPQT